VVLPSHSEPAPTQPAATSKRESGAYGRLGAGVNWPETGGFKDTNCASKQPPALFGCGAGNNGRRLGATGGFDPALVLEGGLGYRFNRWIRAEALLSWQPDLDFKEVSALRQLKTRTAAILTNPNAARTGDDGAGHKERDQ
jgi:hypothetical protein